MDKLIRSRRLRTDSIIRKMTRETRIDLSSIIYPIFVTEGEHIKEEIPSMIGQYKYSLDMISYRLEELQKDGLNKILLFGVPSKKDECGSSAFDDNGIVQKALRYIKSKYNNIYCITDVCMCAYTSHGHCGILHDNYVDNDETIKILSNIALSHVSAGADMVAPSDMMDYRIEAIRRVLDTNNYTNTPIMSYAVKYASSFYGPFREAANSSPSFGDRKSYQMDYHNRREAIKEVLQDIKEGADIIMVKPALAYGDIIREVSNVVDVPIAAYSVSGEYAMVKQAALANCIDENLVIAEMATSAFRSGASIYITYFANEVARCIKDGIIG